MCFPFTLLKEVSLVFCIFLLLRWNGHKIQLITSKDQFSVVKYVLNFVQPLPLSKSKPFYNLFTYNLFPGETCIHSTVAFHFPFPTNPVNHPPVFCFCVFAYSGGIQCHFLLLAHPLCIMYQTFIPIMAEWYSIAWIYWNSSVHPLMDIWAISSNFLFAHNKILHTSSQVNTYR